MSAGTNTALLERIVVAQWKIIVAEAISARPAARWYFRSPRIHKDFT